MYVVKNTLDGVEYADKFFDTCKEAEQYAESVSKRYKTQFKDSEYEVAFDPVSNKDAVDSLISLTKCALNAIEYRADSDPKNQLNTNIRASELLTLEDGRVIKVAITITADLFQ